MINDYKWHELGYSVVLSKEREREKTKAKSVWNKRLCLLNHDLLKFGLNFNAHSLNTKSNWPTLNSVITVILHYCSIVYFEC